jgi:hypothetical protein
MAKRTGELTVTPKEQTLRSALIALLSDKTIGLLLVALVADILAADAKFNDWIAVDGKQSLSDDALLDVIGAYDEIRVQCLLAIEQFESSGDLMALERALGPPLETLRKLRP